MLIITIFRKTGIIEESVSVVEEELQFTKPQMEIIEGNKFN